MKALEELSIAQQYARAKDYRKAAAATVSELRSQLTYAEGRLEKANKDENSALAAYADSVGIESWRLILL